MAEEGGGREREEVGRDGNRPTHRPGEGEGRGKGVREEEGRRSGWVGGEPTHRSTNRRTLGVGMWWLCGGLGGRRGVRSGREGEGGGIVFFCGRGSRGGDELFGYELLPSR